MPEQLISELQALVGKRHVLCPLVGTPVGDLAAYTTDWRRRYHGQALAVVLPATTAEVAQLVQTCARHGVAIVPQGGNTSLVGGAVPDASGTQIVLSLRRLNQVRHLDTANLTLTAEAGCVLAQVQQVSLDAGLLFPLSLASEGSCTVGGVLSSNAGGTQVLRWGNARALCLGLEVVTAQGEVWHGLTGLRKDNTGYDLQDLYIGSEGTLGIITAATLKLFPAPAAVMTAWVQVADPDAAIALLSSAQAHLGPGLSGFELMNDASLQLVAKHHPALPVPPWQSGWTALLELSDHQSPTHAQAALETWLSTVIGEAGPAQNAVIAQNLQQAQDIWAVREAIPLAQAAEGLNVKHDIAVPVSAIPRFIERTHAAVRDTYPGARFITFGHAGDGNLHYNIQAPLGADPAEFLASHEAGLNALVEAQVAALGGSISAEHGIGQLKAERLPLHKSPVALKLMRQIKQALDPQGTLNPGKVLTANQT